MANLSDPYKQKHVCLWHFIALLAREAEDENKNPKLETSFIGAIRYYCTDDDAVFDFLNCERILSSYISM